MKHLIKSSIVVGLFLFGSSVCFAQEQSKPINLESAGDPRCKNTFGIDSCTITLYVGNVVEVIDGQTIVVRLRNFDSSGSSNKSEEGHKTQIRLADISIPDLDKPLGEKAKQNLKKLVLGKTVFVKRFCKAGTFAVDYQGLDLGLEQIRAGFARYDDSIFGTIESDKCNYRYAEEKARADKIGIWREKTK